MDQLIRPLSFVALILLCACIHAQEDAYIDARAGSEPRPKFDRGMGSGGGMGCGDGCKVEEPVKIELTKMIATDSVPPESADWYPKIQSARTVEWTVRITNQTKKPLYIPTSLSWSGEERREGKSQAVLDLSISLWVRCVRGINQRVLDLSSFVDLYGAVDRSSHVMPVEPSHWITVVGTGAACPVPNQEDQYRTSVSIDKVSRFREDGKDLEDSQPLLGFSQSQTIFWIGEGTWIPDSTK